MLAVGLSCMTFIEVYSLHTHFLENLYHRWIFNFWIFVKTVSASIEMIIGFLFFNLLMWCITLIDLWILKNSCIPGIKPSWSWCMIFLICCWILFARILLRILHLCSSVILACSFLFLWDLCPILVSGWWWPHRMSLGVYLPVQFTGRVWVDRC